MSSKKDGGVPNYLRSDYEKFGLDPNEKNKPSIGKTWTCPRCGTTNFVEHVKCKHCSNARPNP